MAVVALVGTAGSGKSYLMARMLKEDPNLPQVLVGLAADKSLRKFLKRPEWKWQTITSPLSKVWLDPAERVAVDLTPLTPVEAQISLQALMKGVVDQGGGVVAIDEAHLFLTRPTAQIVRYIRGSRHFRLKVYIATQRWVDIHPHIRAVVKHLFIFRTTSWRDINALQSEPGVYNVALDRLNTGEYIYVRR